MERRVDRVERTEEGMGFSLPAGGGDSGCGVVIVDVLVVVVGVSEISD